MVIDDTDRDALIKQQARRDLLTTLKIYYPAAADFESLRLIMPGVARDNLDKDINYLIDKGYVTRFEPRANQALDKQQFRLAAKGVEQADRITMDPALFP